MPVFALGRAQELLLILDEYWEAHPELDSIPIYYASSLAKKCMAVYQTYINMMNAKIRKQFAISNPFVFKHISNLRNVEQFEDSGPCVMMASPGMLQVMSWIIEMESIVLIYIYLRMDYLENYLNDGHLIKRMAWYSPVIVSKTHWQG